MAQRQSRLGCIAWSLVFVVTAMMVFAGAEPPRPFLVEFVGTVLLIVGVAGVIVTIVLSGVRE